MAEPTATPTRIPGDFNGDNFVDIRDYGVWRQNFGQTNCGNPADADGNCLVDIRDYGIWRQHFGEGTPPDRRAAGALPAGSSPAPPPAPRRTPGPASPTDALPAADFTATEWSAKAGDRASDGGWFLLRAEGGGPAVPVIPEADGLGLLLGGLFGLGLLAGWRARRPPPRE